MYDRRSMLAAGLVVGSLLAVACGGAGGGPTAGGNPTAGEGADRILIDGSSTVFPITQLAAEEFNAAHPEVEISVGVSGTGGGFSKFCAGETDISDASRPIAEDEAQACADAGIAYTEFQVGIDGLSVVVPPSVDWVECLTVDQLRRIWEQGSTVQRWSDVDPGFPEVPLELFGPGPDSGTYDYFVEAVLGEDARPRTDYTASEDDNVLVQGVAGSTDGLGYFGYAYYVPNQDRLRALAIDAGNGCVAPTPQTVNDGTYPLARPLFIYVRNDAVERPAVRDFVSYYLDNAARLAEAVGYVAPHEDALAGNQQRWQELVAASSG